MLKYFTRHFFTLSVIFLSVNLVLAPIARAEEIIISENGSDSSNQTSVSSVTTTQVQQTNEATVDNDVNVSSDTGGNTASSNTGSNVSLTTGDAAGTVTVQNSANSSVTQIDNCCTTDPDVSIDGNGSESNNTIDINLQNTTTTSINQTAQISNNIQGTANTGGNSANDNSGDVSISTGDIKVNGVIVNGPVNASFMNISSGINPVTAEINGNGFNSDNIITSIFERNNTVAVNQYANIENIANWDLTTGNNSANANTGTVKIKTGDINFDLFINNFANISKVIIDCCGEEEKPTEEVDENDGEENNNVSGGDGEAKKSEDGRGGVLLPEAASTQAPQIIGLSDTTSDAAHTLFFWIGLMLITFGLKFIGQSISPKKLARSNYLI